MQRAARRRAQAGRTPWLTLTLARVSVFQSRGEATCRERLAFIAVRRSWMRHALFGCCVHGSRIRALSCCPGCPERTDARRRHPAQQGHRVLRAPDGQLPDGRQRQEQRGGARRPVVAGVRALPGRRVRAAHQHWCVAYHESACHSYTGCEVQRQGAWLVRPSRPSAVLAAGMRTLHNAAGSIRVQGVAAR